MPPAILERPIPNLAKVHEQEATQVTLQHKTRYAQDTFLRLDGSWASVCEHGKDPHRQAEQVARQRTWPEAELAPKMSQTKDFWRFTTECSEKELGF